MKWALALISVAATLLCLEIAFRFVPRSHGVGYSLASRLWFEKFWRVNELGYRDRDYTSDDVVGKRRIVVIGDSIVAGHGIARTEDRFSDRLGRLLGEAFVVLNVARNGADTRAEYGFLESFPHAPDVVVLSYFVNDIEGAARAAGKFPALVFEPYADLPVPLRSLFGGSYLLNYLYWTMPHGDVDRYVGALRDAYHDPAVFAAHLRDLAKFVEYRDRRRVPLVVVLFPNPKDLDMSAATLRELRDFFERGHVPVVDVSELVRAMRPADRVVNANDAHPSAEVHALVAEALARQIALY